jgi:hypothetical protein
MRKIILKHAILYSLSIPSVAAKVDSLIRYDSDLYAEIVNPKTEFETTKHSRVESNGGLAPIPLLPLVKPDVRISRIRLSCKRSS